MARIAGMWTASGTGRVIGPTTSTNAAHILAAEGITGAYSLADFLGRLPGTDQPRDTCLSRRMAAAACRRWLADYLSGRDTLLLVTAYVQAAELARRVRAELAALGLVARDDTVELYDGNIAGAGDLVVARQNARITAGERGGG